MNSIKPIMIFGDVETWNPPTLDGLQIGKSERKK